MRIRISTLVDENYKKVFSMFNREFFIKLAPPLFKFELKNFDGCITNDLVHIELDFVLFKQDWISLISDHGADSDELYFIDEGIKLPFFLKYWKHKHRIQNYNGKTRIVDDIIYTTPNKLLDILIYPSLYFMFYYRKHIYQNTKYN